MLTKVVLILTYKERQTKKIYQTIHLGIKNLHPKYHISEKIFCNQITVYIW